MPSLIDTFACREQPPSNTELESLMGQMFPDFPQFMMELMGERIMKQVICRGYYHEHHLIQGKKKRLVIHQLHLALKVSITTVYRWCRADLYPVLESDKYAHLDD